MLAANRGEIAIRVFRACTELGVRTVAIYSHEDLLSIHRYKADEAFLIGERGRPIDAYLDQEAILDLAVERGVDAIHPGYGFLSENEHFARRCAERGVAFIGPPPDVLQVLGDKTTARQLATRAGVPVVPGTDGAIDTVEAAAAFAAEHGYPILLKAAFGGGGRGMRIVRSEAELAEAFERAHSEAQSAFGRGALFCEKLIERAKHIEVQILADHHGGVVHLFERDCSVQRRHQKVIEVAPAVDLGEQVRHELYQAALRIASTCGYQGAGTVEFLVTDAGWYFIEVNPRLQVEHTVTEEITGRDLVQAQIRIAEGRPLSDPLIGIASQSAITRTGFAVQCRITTEDPERGFLPDTGKILAYRSAAGFGIRLDASTGGAGTVITGDYDSMIVKLTARALSFPEAVAKVDRSLREFRIRGVKTNIPFLENTLAHPVFRAGQATTRFVEETPALMRFPRRRDRATRLLRALAGSVVNGPPGAEQRLQRPSPLFTPVVPAVDLRTPAPVSPAMAVFRAEGAAGLSRWLRATQRVQITDTTFRDAHQSLLATRVRTADLLAIAPATARLAPALFSVEMWGGATFDVAYRFLKEDPWDRLDRLREAFPHTLLQMLLRGANAVGYTNYPDNVIRRFVQRAASGGVDVFRVFDALNWVPNMALAMEEVGAAGKIVEACLCYSGDVGDPAREPYTLDYYVDLGRSLAAHGAHILAIKDMAGLLKPRAARLLVPALRDATGLPVHVHTHDTSGNGIAMLLAAIEAGADAVDVALSSMSGLTSQPSLNALVACLEGDDRAPGLDAGALQTLADYWEAVRDLYAPFESGLKASSADVYRHEIPGGQYSNLRPRAIQLGLGARWNEIKARYREVSLAFGDVIKVTPTSKVVADFAMFLVQNDLDVEQAIAAADRLDFPQSVVDFFSGHLGQPYRGFPERLQRAVLKGRPALTDRAGLHLPDHDFDAAQARLTDRLGRPAGEHELLTDALYPKVFEEYLAHTDAVGNISRLPTAALLYGLEVGETILVEIEPGKTLVVKLTAVGGLTADGHRMVYFELNGQPREVAILDREAAATVVRRPRAEPGNPAHLGAAMPGKVSEVKVKVGEAVAAGATLLVTEAMKMETAITAPRAGRVAELHVAPGDAVAGGDLLVVLAPTD
ncbi:MAG: pyruvate carboxylase [Myxococcales bacterium]|nr:pyruvate carboxylase [Myxococcales bacterium]